MAHGHDSSIGKKGFFTMEILLSFTIFVLILLSFQSVFRESIRIQRFLENSSVGLLERSIFEEKLSEDLNFVIPLKDGRMFFLNETPSLVTLRFISTKRLTIPARGLESHIILVEYQFSKTPGSPLLIRKEKALEGYNEFVLENFSEADFEEAFLPGWFLVSWESRSERRLNWLEHPESLSFRFSPDEQENSNLTLDRSYPISLFRLKEAESGPVPSAPDQGAPGIPGGTP